MELSRAYITPPAFRILNSINAKVFICPFSLLWQYCRFCYFWAKRWFDLKKIKYYSKFPKCLLMYSKINCTSFQLSHTILGWSFYSISIKWYTILKALILFLKTVFFHPMLITLPNSLLCFASILNFTESSSTVLPLFPLYFYILFWSYIHDI